MALAMYTKHEFCMNLKTNSSFPFLRVAHATVAKQWLLSRDQIDGPVSVWAIVVIPSYVIHLLDQDDTHNFVKSPIVQSNKYYSPHTMIWNKPSFINVVIKQDVKQGIVAVETNYVTVWRVKQIGINRIFRSYEENFVMFAILLFLMLRRTNRRATETELNVR
ncbi:hypothetical protein P9112_011193 [Eukaryota sp. TZLM1-RC]